MFAAFLQYLFSGLTSGAIYALAGLGFAIIYNASHVINFAQGEFIMIGGMATATMVAAGVPVYLAIPLAMAASMAATGGIMASPVGTSRSDSASASRPP